MPFLSSLFDGDARLEACRTSDAAHLTSGARGEHVAKVQMALAAIDGARINEAERRTQTYGPSTAAAVLAYKRQRSVINRSYQTTADNIVGKMTVVAIDRELVAWEARHRRIGDCICGPVLGGGPSEFSIRGVEAGAGRKPQFGRFARIYCAITKKAALETGFPLSRQLDKAREALFEFGITLSVEVRSGFADTIDFPSSIVIDDDVAMVRKASEDQRPGMPTTFRILVVPMSVNGPFGQTFRGITFNNQVFPPFAVLNSRCVATDNATLLHEMIHGAHGGPIPHDPEPMSVFFETGSAGSMAVERNMLKEKYAKKISESFYAI